MGLRRLLPPLTSDSLAVASVAARLAVFMRAGLPPARAWMELAGNDPLPVVKNITTLLESGVSLPTALEELVDQDEEAWRVVGAVHQVARETGAPLGEALWALADALRERQDVAAAVRQAVIAPVYTQRLLMALPLLGLATSWALGVDAIGFLTGSALGWGSLAVAVILLLVAGRWSGKMIRAAMPGPGYLSPSLDLLAIAASGGSSPEAARLRVEQVLDDYRIPAASTGELPELTELSRRVGVPLGALAKAEASWARARAKATALEGANALSVKILFPLGALVLPAFVLIAVIPVVFALLQGALSGDVARLW